MVFNETQYKIQTPFVLNLSISHSLALVSHTTIISVHCLFASFIFSIVLGISVHVKQSVLPFASHWYLYFCHTNYDTVFKNAQEVHFFFLIEYSASWLTSLHFLIFLKRTSLCCWKYYSYILTHTILIHYYFSLYQLLTFNIFYLYICYFLCP